MFSELTQGIRDIGKKTKCRRHRHSYKDEHMHGRTDEQREKGIPNGV